MDVNLDHDGGSGMEFCPECESLLYPQKNAKGKMVLKCRKCGTEIPLKKNTNVEPVKIKEELNHEEEDIPVIEDEIDTLPTRREICEKCGNDQAFYWQVQTRSADESMTTFFRCTKCKHTWREYE
ncbi:MAG: transcription factor S [Candidatus Helarchaeales archaeon]